ncbi:MAG: hypothetical protein EXS14_03670 [Planctomycetes bacterium]|nr:hypothetical protein [Planctomycetota bacterium]
MFQGRWPNLLSLDAKNRLALPARFRVDPADAEGGSEFMLGALEDPCLYVHTPAQHAVFLDRLFGRLGDTRASRRAKTYILSRFVPVGADAQGRITIPAFLITHGRLSKEVLLVAQESRLEIWATEVFGALESEVQGTGIADTLEAVFAEEEQERRLLRRTASPAREGNSLST